MTDTFQYDSPLAYDINVAYDAYAPAQTEQVNPVLAHLSVSFLLANDGTFAFLTQGSLDEVAQSVSMIVGTTVGDRTVVPTFGIPEQPFDGPDKTAITSAINSWENRAAVRVAIATNDDGTSAVRVAVARTGGVPL